MNEDSKADQARKGLFDSVKGKAKEVAGAVTGNDSLTAEGQLEQTQAPGTQRSQQRRGGRGCRGRAGTSAGPESPGRERRRAHRGERRDGGSGARCS